MVAISTTSWRSKAVGNLEILTIMRRLNLILVSVTSALCVCGCATESVEPLVEGTVLKIETESRTSLGELNDGVRHVYWSTGDVVAANGCSSAALSAEYDGSRGASFSFDQQLTPPFEVVYPASIYKDENTITLGRVHSGLAEDFDAPMCAYADGMAFTMKHLCGVVRVSILGKENLYELLYVAVISGENEAMYGDFIIDHEAGTLVAVEDGRAAYNNRRAVAKVVPSTERAVDVFVTIPARTYNSGFTVRVVNKYGHYQDFVTTKSQTVERGKVLAMPEVVFEPTSTIFDIDISM